MSQRVHDGEEGDARGVRVSRFAVAGGGPGGHRRGVVRALPGRALSEPDKWEDYIGAIDRGELPLNRALPVTPHQMLVREMILQLKTGRFDAGVLPQ